MANIVQSRTQTQGTVLPTADPTQTLTDAPTGQSDLDSTPLRLSSQGILG